MTGPDRSPDDLSPQAVLLRDAPSAFAPVSEDSPFESRDVGLAEATAGGHTGRIFRARRGGRVISQMHHHDATFQYVHILKGEIEFELEGGRTERLAVGDAIYQPGGCLHRVIFVSADLELLEIFSPSEIATIRAER